MKIDDTLLSRLEKLSMVEVENREEIKSELSDIVNFVDILNELDTDNVSATFNTLNAKTPLREDAPIKSDVIDSIMKNAPKAEENYFIVPTIIES
jgi:aspartyl-tRNA(Asn)/glutamyl-tRNA(Gln) amidotransferase subunit C